MNKKKVKFREYMIHMLQEVRGVSEFESVGSRLCLETGTHYPDASREKAESEKVLTNEPDASREKGPLDTCVKNATNLRFLKSRFLRRREPINITAPAGYARAHMSRHISPATATALVAER